MMCDTHTHTGKIITGPLADRIGGKYVFVCGAVMSACATYAFSTARVVWVITLSWCANRFSQSAGYGSGLKVCDV